MKRIISALCAGAALLLASCTENIDASKAVIGDWTIIEADGITVEKGFETPSLSFGDDGVMHGNTSINKMFGGYTVSSDKEARISFGNLGMTRMAGPTFETENAITAGLGKAAKVKFSDLEHMQFLDAEGNVVMVLEKGLPAAELTPAETAQPAGETTAVE